MDILSRFTYSYAPTSLTMHIFIQSLSGPFKLTVKNQRTFWRFGTHEGFAEFSVYRVGAECLYSLVIHLFNFSC